MTLKEIASEYLQNLLTAKWDKKEAEAGLIAAERVESKAHDELILWMKEEGLHKITVDGWYLEPSTDSKLLLTLKSLDSLDEEDIDESEA